LICAVLPALDRLEGHNIACIHSKRFRSRLDTGDSNAFDTPRNTSYTSPVKTEQYNKYKRPGGHEHVVFVCDTLEQHGEKPENKSEKVLRRADLAGADWNEPASVSALFHGRQKTLPQLGPHPATLTMTIILTMTLLPPMNRMIAPEYHSCLWGSYRVI
jgi:hypothetical protein